MTKCNDDQKRRTFCPAAARVRLLLVYDHKKKTEGQIMESKNTSRHEILEIYKDGDLLYPIVLAESIYGLGNVLKSLSAQQRKICIVSDDHVAPLYAEITRKICSEIFHGVSVFTFPAGEENKTLETVQDLYAFLIENRFERGDMLLALGGGVTGDLTGYTAATYLRGIRFIQVPTSLLAQVDSSIGGKTGVDFRSYKNMVGAFHQPSLVYSSADVLRTLPNREFISGMGEIIKHGLIRDVSYYQWLKENRDRILEREPAVLLQMILRSDEIKKQVVENDPLEKGERAILNFGHTIGHAVEKRMDFSLLHGECVAIGMIAASWISMQKGLLNEQEYADICQTIQSFGLPAGVGSVKREGSFTPEELVETTKSDKKMERGNIRFILLDSIGRAVIDTSLSDEDLLSAAEIIMEEGL